MTLATIMKLALRQLDEEAQSIGEHEELFKSYANMGYMIALRLYLKPRAVLDEESDAHGCVNLEGVQFVRVIEVRDMTDRNVAFELDSDGYALHTDTCRQKLKVVCEIDCPPMTDSLDKPMLPEYVQPALADYICYRHLSCGSLSKQSRAEFFRNSFYEQMRAIRPQGMGSVTRRKNLYSATN